MKKLIWLCMMMLVLSLSGPAAMAEEDYMTDSGEMRETDDGEVMEDSGEIDQMDDSGDYMDDSGEERNDSDY